MSKAWVVAVMVVLGGVVQADPLTNDEYMVIKPEGMNDTAHAHGRPIWCVGKFQGEMWDKNRLRRAIVGFNGLDSRLAEAAEHICQWADDPTWQKQSAYLVQEWMNIHNNSQDDAEAQIKAQIAQNKVDAANEGKEPTDEERFAFDKQDLTPEKPEPGADVAKLGAKAAWCEGAKISEKWNSGRIGREMKERYGITGTLNAALHVCQRPNDASWKTEAQYVLQRWINWTGMTQAEAEADLKIRIQDTKMSSDHAALCKGLDTAAEVGGQEKAYAKARRQFFGCDKEGQEGALWSDTTNGGVESVGIYLDDDVKPDSELMRLYWLFTSVPNPGDKELPSKDASENRGILYYAMASYDFDHIDTAVLDKEVAGAPYNDYARAVVHESVAKLRWYKKTYEAAIDKLVKSGSEYQKILRDAPKAGFAEWDKAIAPWKAEIERSNAFEKQLAQPSRKELHGCSTTLWKDAEKVVKSWKLTEWRPLVEKARADPVAMLLFSRLAICLAIEDVPSGPGALKGLIEHGRQLRGPRSLAYYAIVDAMADALKDRPRMLVKLESFWLPGRSLVDLYDNELTFDGSLPDKPDNDLDKGIVKSATKGANGVKVVFKTVKITFPLYDCTPTNRPVRIDENGRIEYAENCKANGKTGSQDETPRPVTIPTLLATGIAPGVFLSDSQGKEKNGETMALPTITKKSSSDKKLATWLGFSL